MSEEKQCTHDKLSRIGKVWGLVVSKDNAETLMGRRYICLDCHKEFEINLMYNIPHLRDL